MPEALTIWKYQLTIQDEQLVEMPLGSSILAVAEQDGTLCLWARVNPEGVPVNRKIYIRGTGHPLPKGPIEYIGTVVSAGGRLVWHILDGGNL